MDIEPHSWHDHFMWLPCSGEQVDSKVSVVLEQFLRLMHTVGFPIADVDFMNSDGRTMQRVLHHAKPRNTLFTGCASAGLSFGMLYGELIGTVACTHWHQGDKHVLVNYDIRCSCSCVCMHACVRAGAPVLVRFCPKS
jgi:hypothetical protein